MEPQISLCGISLGSKEDNNFAHETGNENALVVDIGIPLSHQDFH